MTSKNQVVPVRKQLKLEPESTKKLQNFAGVNNINIKWFEEQFQVTIRLRSFTIALESDSQTNVARAEKILPLIYSRTSLASSPNIQQLHLLLQEFSDENDYTQVPILLKAREIRPRGRAQNQYVQQIDDNYITFGIGAAGTGKTFLAVAKAISALEKGDVERIVLVRPAIEAGEKLGFLPGDLEQKVNPYLRPLFDGLYAILGVDIVDRLLARKVIEIAPLAYMRGRTLSSSFVIFDESQNSTCEQMKMLLTRIGHSTKVVVTGDTSQIDLPKNLTSGLMQAEHIFQNIQGVGFTYFEAKDVLRHPIVRQVISAYQKTPCSSQ